MKAAVKAYVLLKVKTGFEEKALARIENFDQVREISVVFGKYDLHLTVEMNKLENLDDFVLNSLRNVEGVSETMTLLCIEI